MWVEEALDYGQHGCIGWSSCSEEAKSRIEPADTAPGVVGRLLRCRWYAFACRICLYSVASNQENGG